MRVQLSEVGSVGAAYMYMRSKDTFGMMRALLDLFEVGFGGEDYDDNEDLY